MVWTLSDGTTTYSCLGNSVIRNKLNELDSAEVQCVGTFTPDTVVYIVDGGTEIFRGYIKESKQEANGKLYKLTLVESAQDLKYKIIEYSGSRSFIRSGDTVATLITMMINDTGWVAGTTDTTVITSIGFYNMTASAGIYKLIKEMQGKYVWYVNDGNDKAVFWGSVRTDRTGTPITSYISKQAETDSIDRNIDKITVYGENSTIYGSYGTGTKEKLYKYAPAKTAYECTDVATKLLADIGNNKQRYVLTLPKTNTYYVGDKIKVDSVDYIIFDITRTTSTTTLGIGGSDVSYAETLGGNLTVVDGSIKTPVDAQWSGGNTNVSANASEATTFIFDIKDATMVSNPYIDATIGDYIKTATVAAETEYLSSVDTVSGGGAGTDVATFVTSFYFPDEDGASILRIADGFQHALFTLNCEAYSYEPAMISAELQLSYNNGSTWSSSIGIAYSALTTTRRSFNITGMASGSTTSETAGQMKFRYYVSCWDKDDATAIEMKVYNLYGTVYRVPRHKHAVTTTYDKTTISGSKPSTIQVSINGESFYTTLTPGTPLRVNTYWTLITGKNTISVKTPSGAGNQCSVNPTITYKTL
jgi:hypothetical protein